MILNPLSSDAASRPSCGWVVWCIALPLLWLFASLALAADEAGRFQFVHGQVQVERDNRTLNATRGMNVLVGDKITTEAASSAQIRMVDGALMALRPRSELLIEDYAFAGNDEDSTLVNLTRGGLRSVTGAIGRSRPENVKIDTPVATMGIRGTDMDTFVPPASNQQQQQAVLRVNSGRGTMTSGGVLIEVPAGSIGQVIRGQTPRIIPALPPEAEAQEAEADAAGEEEESSSSGNEEEATGGDEEESTTDEDSAGDTETPADEQPSTNEQQSQQQSTPPRMELPAVLPSLQELQEIRPTLENLNLLPNESNQIIEQPAPAPTPEPEPTKSRVIITIQ